MKKPGSNDAEPQTSLWPLSTMKSLGAEPNLPDSKPPATSSRVRLTKPNVMAQSKVVAPHAQVTDRAAVAISAVTPLLYANRTTAPARLPNYLPVINAGTLSAEPNQRPTTTADCPTVRPCPWVSCRYHLLLDVTAHGTIKLNNPHTYALRKHHSQTAFDLFTDDALEHLDMMTDTCALDVAARGTHNNEEIAELLSYTREAMRQLMLEPEQILRDGLKEFDPNSD